MGWVQKNLAENESHNYPNMCAKFGCDPTVVSKKRGGGGTDRQTKKTAASYSRYEIRTISSFDCVTSGITEYHINAISVAFILFGFRSSFEFGVYSGSMLQNPKLSDRVLSMLIINA